MAIILSTKNGSTYPGPDLEESSLRGKVNTSGYPIIRIQASQSSLSVPGTIIGPLSGMTVYGETTELHFFTVFNKVISFIFDSDRWFDLETNAYDYRGELAAILNSNSIDDYANLGFSFGDLIAKINRDLSGISQEPTLAPITEVIPESSLMALLLALTNTSSVSQPSVSPASTGADRGSIDDTYGDVPILTSPLGIYVKSICAYMSDWHRKALEWYRVTEDTSNYVDRGEPYKLQSDEGLKAFLVDKFYGDSVLESPAVNSFAFNNTDQDRIEEYDEMKSRCIATHLPESGDLIDLYYNPMIPDSPLNILDNTPETPESLVDSLIASDELQASSKIMYQQIVGTSQAVTTVTKDMVKSVITKIQKLRNVKSKSFGGSASVQAIDNNIRAEYTKYFSAYKRLLAKASKIA